MSATVPTVMVSSTFFDLQQVRSDLTEFLIDQMGYAPLLSELNSFPVAPELDTIENCKKRVEENADILVLIIGGRYGEVDNRTNRSVTNLEYLEARAKGIPIYAFVRKDVLTVLSIWESNPEGDFSSVVQTNQVFSFIKEVRSVDKVWMHQFEKAEDIIVALRTQFAHLTLTGVKWHQQLQGSSLAGLIRSLSPAASQLVLRRSKAWEYKLLFQVMLDELDRCRELRREHELGLAFGTAEIVSPETFGNWSKARIAELIRIGDNLGILFKKPIEEAVGPPGHAGDPERLVFIARRVGLAYEDCLRWAQRVRTAAADDIWHGLLAEMAKFADDMIEKLETWCRSKLDEVDEVERRVEAGETVAADFTLDIKLGGDMSRFSAELARIEQHYVSSRYSANP